MSERILIVNDDGYEAKGINFLYDIAKNNCSDDVWMVAPNENNSAISSSLRAGIPFDIIKHGEKIFSLTSTPVICFNVANIKILSDKKPDIVLSGINRGLNVGLINRYSGTFAVIMEACMFGIPGIALSQGVCSESVDENKDDIFWEVSKHFAPKILSYFIDFTIKNKLMLNINFPKCKLNEVKSIIYAPQDTKISINRNLIDLPDGKYVFKDTIFSNKDGFNDYSLVKDNHIVVTSYSLDWNDMKNVDVISDFVANVNSKINS